MFFGLEERVLKVFAASLLSASTRITHIGTILLTLPTTTLHVNRLSPKPYPKP